MTLSDVRQAIADAGLAYRGVAQVEAGEAHFNLAASSIVLVGFSGDQGWESFRASAEWSDGDANPLDRWTKRILYTITGSVGALPLFPFEGPRWWPFQKWARKAEAVFPTPVGMLIHSKWGLWHSWRGALVLRVALDAPVPEVNNNPCVSCVEKACLKTCPVQAFKLDFYDTASCLGFLNQSDENACMSHGCAARRACPVGVQYRYPAERAGFHMKAFRDGQARSR